MRRIESALRFATGLLLGQRGAWAGRRLLAVEDRVVAPSRPGDRPFAARTYVPRDAAGAFLVSPGMQPFGPQDERLDRFARVLAGAGFVTLVPYLPDTLALRLEPRSADDLSRAFAALLAEPHLPPGCRPGVFSVSIGSFAAASVAADPRWRARVRALFMFGGYSRWRDVLRYALGVSSHRTPPDRLLRPVVFINLAEQFPTDAAARAVLRDRFQQFVTRTWRVPNNQKDVFVRARASELAETLPESLREFFLIGCGVAPGAEALADDLLARATQGRNRGEALDLTGPVSQLCCPVHVIHGSDDNVVPFEHAQELLDAVPPSTPRSAYLLRGFGHSGETPFRTALRAPARVTRQVWVQLRLAAAIGALATSS